MKLQPEIKDRVCRPTNLRCDTTDCRSAHLWRCFAR